MEGGERKGVEGAECQEEEERVLQGKYWSVLRVGSDFSGGVKARTRVRCWQAD